MQLSYWLAQPTPAQGAQKLPDTSGERAEPDAPDSVAT